MIRIPLTFNPTLDKWLRQELPAMRVETTRPTPPAIARQPPQNTV
jgi:hypothetical protein